MLQRRLFIAAVLGLTLALPASAAAPEPVKPLDLDRFMGRWYEILRTPNDRQKDCHAAWQVWSRKGKGFRISQNCRRGSRTGPVETVMTSAKVIDTRTNAKFEASFFGGIIRKDYWVIDRADDYSWMIASSADGKFPAVLARTPGLPPARQAELKRRMAQLGLPTARLQSVGAP